MLIYLVVCSFQWNNSGTGGHYFSLLSTAEASRAVSDVSIVSIGDFFPDALKNAGSDLLHLNVPRYSLSQPLALLEQRVLMDRPSVLHAYDQSSLLFCRIIGLRNGIPVCSTKCGGSRKWYWPRKFPDIVFSSADASYYQKRALASPSRDVHLVPGRVSKRSFTSDSLDGEAELPAAVINSGKKIVMRIGRFHPAYEHSFRQAIDLAEQLSCEGIECCAVLIGHPSDPEVVSRLGKPDSDGLYIFTEEKYTRRASRHIRHADIVVASGRGVMEAAAGSKIVCCSPANSSLPVLVEESNFLDLFSENFSSRSKVSKSCDLSGFVQLLSKSDDLKRYTDSISSIFHKYFDVDKSVKVHVSIYQSLPVESPSLSTMSSIFFEFIFDWSRKLFRGMMASFNRVRAPRGASK